MKPLFLISATAIIALEFLAGPAQAQEKKQARAEEAIIKMEKEWADALVKADQAVIDRLVTPDWTVIGADGKRQSKAQADEELKSGAVKFESFKMDELNVKVYGKTAVAQGVETEKSSYKGKDTSGQYRFTDVFVKRNGRWQAVATQITRVEKS
jgi:ketosteroid isomerase-like protein